MEALRDQFGFPGMKILQFAFGSGPDNIYLPHNHVHDAIVYTGTHDNDTTAGWFDSLPEKDRQDVLDYLELPGLAQSQEGYWVDRLPATVAEVAADLGLEDVDLDVPPALVHHSLPLAARAVELIVRELLVNARKFHPSRQPRVEIAVFQPSANKIGLRVADDGGGVLLQQLDRIWLPYFQAERHFTGQVPGMGLGLSMVATLIWSVGGACVANNRTDGHGLVVEIVLPELASGG